MKRHDRVRIKEDVRRWNKDDGRLFDGEVVDDVYEVQDVFEKNGKTLATIFPRVVSDKGVECQPRINLSVENLVVVEEGVPSRVKEMAKRLAKLDDRKHHPEDYYARAEFLLDMKAHEKYLGQLKLLLDHTEFHTHWRYTFSDFFRVIVGRVPQGLRESYENKI